jgi:hypothetical protein
VVRRVSSHNWSFRKINNVPESSTYITASDLREEEAGGHRKLHEELHDLLSSLNVVRVI